MSGTRKHTPRQLSGGLEALHYEMGQLVNSFQRGKNQAVAHALLESRLLHARNLLMFFSRSQAQNNDILAVDYRFPVAASLIAQPYKQKLDRDLAHLSYDRVERSPADKEWPFEDVFVPILDQCLRFIDHLPKAGVALDPSWVQRWKELAGHIETVRSQQRMGRLGGVVTTSSIAEYSYSIGPPDFTPST